MVALEYTGHTMIHFEDHSYRWFNLIQFAWNGEGSDTDVLAALIAHRQYRDTFMSPDSHERDAVDIHGPYHLAAITPDVFESIDAAGAIAVVEEFYDVADTPRSQETQQEVADDVISRFIDASCYRLRPLPEAVHDFGFVLWEFREVVAISRERGEVLMVVMAID